MASTSTIARSSGSTTLSLQDILADLSILSSSSSQTLHPFLQQGEGDVTIETADQDLQASRDFLTAAKDAVTLNTELVPGEGKTLIDLLHSKVADTQTKADGWARALQSAIDTMDNGGAQVLTQTPSPKVDEISPQDLAPAPGPAPTSEKQTEAAEDDFEDDDPWDLT